MEVIGVLSDTHGCVGGIETALETYRDYGVERIVHCGDFQRAETVELFRGFELEVVRGNCDLGIISELEEAVKGIGGRFHGLTGEIEFAGRRVFFSHGDDRAAITSALASQEYDVVCQGHRHSPWSRFEGKTLFLNPGAVQNGEYCVLNSDLEPIFFG